MNESERKIERLSDISTSLITSADTERFIGSRDRSVELFRKAARAEMDVVAACQEAGSRWLVPHLISGGWCAVHGEDLDFLKTVLEKIHELIVIDKSNNALNNEIRDLKRSLEKLSKKRRD